MVLHLPTPSFPDCSIVCDPEARKYGLSAFSGIESLVAAVKETKIGWASQVSFQLTFHERYTISIYDCNGIESVNITHQ